MTSNQKAWTKLVGLALIMIGAALHTSIFFFHLNLPDYLFFVFWMLCPIGAFVYGLATDHGWWWRIGWCLISLLPLYGPPYVVVSILLEEFTKKRVTGALGTTGVIGGLLLTAIALPGYLTYQNKARQSEAKVGLGGIFTSANELKAKRQTYEISDINQLDYTPGDRPLARYSFWYSVNGIPTLIPGGKQTPKPCDGPPTTVKVVATTNGFTAAARGNIDADPTCDEWSINDAKVLTNTLNDLAN